MVFSKQGNPWKDSVDYKMNKEISDKEKQLREKEKQFVQTLRSGNTKAILETIKEIREHGRITIITEIIDLLLDTDNDEIKDSASALLNDLKSQEAVPSIVAAVAMAGLNMVKPNKTSRTKENFFMFSGFLVACERSTQPSGCLDR